MERTWPFQLSVLFLCSERGWSSFIEKIISEDSTENSSEDSFVKKKLLGFLKLAESISR